MSPTPLPRVTVVTPVYNGEKHLATCIESVLAQTYPNFEYLIINNCSTDRTLEIAQSYAARDPRIRIQSNAHLLDVVASHNRAFELAPAENKYIKIVGADDWLYPNCVSELVKVAEEYPSVGMVTSYVLHGDKVGWDGLPYPSTFVKGRDVCRLRLLNKIMVFGGPSASLLRTEVVKARLPFYTVGNYHGDNEAYLYMLRDHDFGYVHQVLSYNRRGEDSRTTHYLRSFNSHILNVLEEIVTFGPMYLTEAELKKCIVEAQREYYKFLASSIFDFRGKAFWEPHRERLKKLGMPLNYGLLARYGLARILDILLNPKYTIERVYARLLH